MKNVTLMERAADKIALWQLIDEYNGELNSTLENWLLEVERNLSQKVDRYHFALDELENEGERLRKEAQSLLSAARSVERVRDALSDRIKMTMVQLDQKELKGTTYRFKLTKGAKKLVINPDWVPENFKIVKTSYEIDKERVRELLESGQEVPGATLEESHQLRTYINKGE